MPKPKRSYKYSSNVRDLTVVEDENRIARYNWSDFHAARFTIEWDDGILQRTVERAHRNKNGRSTAGPITVVVHPDDRHPQEG